MKLRVLESVFDSWKVVGGFGGMQFIYLNPTSQELHSKEDSKDNRGIIDPDGNLYMDAKWSGDGNEPYSMIIHRYLIEVLNEKGLFKKLSVEDWYKNPDSLRYGFCVQRQKDTLDFYIAESYHRDIIKIPKNMKRVEKIIAKAKIKNPHLNFIL